MAAKRCDQIQVHLTCRVPDKKELDWALEYLDVESKQDLSLDPDFSGAIIAWLVLPTGAERPIAIYGIDRDEGKYGSFAWMMTTQYLQYYKAHRLMIRTIRKVLGDEIASRAYVWGTCRKSSPIVSVLNLIGAEFKVRDEETNFWVLSVNHKLWRTL